MSHLRLLWRCFWLFWHALRADAARADAAVHQVKAWRAVGRVHHHEKRFADHSGHDGGRWGEGQHGARR